jgi:hypothetical protein
MLGITHTYKPIYSYCNVRVQAKKKIVFHSILELLQYCFFVIASEHWKTQKQGRKENVRLHKATSLILVRAINGACPNAEESSRTKKFFLQFCSVVLISSLSFSNLTPTILGYKRDNKIRNTTEFKDLYKTLWLNGH